VSVEDKNSDLLCRLGILIPFLVPFFSFCTGIRGTELLLKNNTIQREQPWKRKEGRHHRCPQKNEDTRNDYDVGREEVAGGLRYRDG